MSDPWTAGLSAISGAKSRRAKKEALKREKRMQRLMTAEELRRLGREQEQVLGAARAQIFSSGFTGYGASSAAYMEDLQTEQAKESSWLRFVGSENIRNIESQEKSLKTQGRLAFAGDMIGIASSGGSSFDWGMGGDTKGGTK